MWHSHLYFLPTISRNDVKSGVNEKILQSNSYNRVDKCTILWYNIYMKNNTNGNVKICAVEKNWIRRRSWTPSLLKTEQSKNSPLNLKYWPKSDSPIKFESILSIFLNNSMLCIIKLIVHTGDCLYINQWFFKIMISLFGLLPIIMRSIIMVFIYKYAIFVVLSFLFLRFYCKYEMKHLLLFYSIYFFITGCIFIV